MNAQTHLLKLEGAPKYRPFVVCDIESKDGPTQNAGFTRPFMVGGYAGSNIWGSSIFLDGGAGQVQIFRNQPEPSRAHGPLLWSMQHLVKGGCVDRFMVWVLETLPSIIESQCSYGDGRKKKKKDRGFKGLTIYAHNGGSFDYLHFLPWLVMHMDDYEFEIIPVQSSIQEIQVKRRGEKKALWFFRDSMKLLPMGLQRACESFNVEGKELDHSLDLPEDHPAWESYLTQDCRALDEVMMKVHVLVEKLGGSVKMTAPSTSMDILRRVYLKASIPRHMHFDECKYKDAALTSDTCSGCCHNFFRDAYYGGRTELFEMDGENLHYYDINSSYVAAMCEPMPVGERIVEHGYIDWRRIEAGWIGFAECEVEIPEDCEIPPLPVKHPNGKLMFLTGRFKGVWDVAELALLDHPRVKGTIRHVGRVVWIEAKPVFRTMMLELYKLRDKSRADYDAGLSLLAKLIGNGLYGKFGQKQDRTQIVHGRHPEFGECFLCGKGIKIGQQLCRQCVGSKPAGNVENNLYYRHKLVDAQYIIPQISAHVTALARIRLFEFDQMALDRGGRVFMNDTDSIITDVELPTSTELGALKDEYPGELIRYTGVQPKVYILERMNSGVFEDSHLSTCSGEAKKKCEGCAPWKVAMKGFPKDQRTKENVLNLRSSLERGDGSVTVGFTRMEKVRGMAMRDGFRTSPRMVRVEKSFQSPYSKRRILKDGRRTMPVVVDFPYTFDGNYSMNPVSNSQPMLEAEAAE